MAPFPHPAHRTGQADLPHPALGQDVTPLLSRATPSAVSEHISEFDRLPNLHVLHHVWYSDWDTFAQVRAPTEMSARPRHSSPQRDTMHRDRVSLLSAVARFQERSGRTRASRVTMNALPRRFVRVHCELGRVSIAQLRVSNPLFWPRQILRWPEVRIGSTFRACPNLDIERRDWTKQWEGWNQKAQRVLHDIRGP